MKRFAIVLAAAAMIAAPAAISQEPKQIQMSTENGSSVDSMLLRYGFDASWAIDKQHYLLRDTYRDHYLVTFDKPCDFLDQPRSVKFVPELTGRLYDTIKFEARDSRGNICDVSKLQKVASKEAGYQIAGKPLKG